MNRWAPLLLILFGSLCLWLLFTSSIPNGYGPDEISHFGYVRFLAEGKGLPVLGRDRDPRGPDYESHQPPLYYALAIPFYLAGRATAGERGAWGAVRGFSLVCGLLTVALVFLILHLLFPDEPALAAAGAAFAGWLPSQAALFSVAGNDPLTELGFTVTLYLLALRLLRQRSAPHPLFIGLAAGLTFLVKASGLLLFVIPPVFLLLERPAAGPSAGRPPFRSVGYFALGAAVCLPWMLRNQWLYHDPLGWGAFVHYFLTAYHSPTPALLARRMGVPYSPSWYWTQRVLPWGYRDSLGMWLFSRGDHAAPMRVGLPSSAYAFWGALWVAAAIGAVRFRLAEWRSRPEAWRRTVLALEATLLLLFAAYLRLNAVFFWAHSRYLFPGIAPIALLWSAGLSRLAPPAYRPALLWAVSGLLFLISLFASYVVLGGYFDAVLRPG